MKIRRCVYWGCINVFRISSCLLVHVYVSTLQMVTLTKQKKKHPSSWVDAPVFVPVSNKSEQSVLVLYPNYPLMIKWGRHHIVATCMVTQILVKHMPFETLSSFSSIPLCSRFYWIKVTVSGALVAQSWRVLYSKIWLSHLDINV